MSKNLFLIFFSLVLMSSTCKRGSDNTAPPVDNDQDGVIEEPIAEPIVVESDAVIMMEDVAQDTRGDDGSEEAIQINYFTLEQDSEGQNVLTPQTVMGVPTFFTVEGTDRMDIAVEASTNVIQCESQNHAGEDMWVEIGGEQGERN